MDLRPTIFRADGTLLLSAEYFILSGAVGLAIPARLGQSMSVHYATTPAPQLTWQSYDDQQKMWFAATFRLPDFVPMQYDTAQQNIVETLQHLAQGIAKQRPDFWQKLPSTVINTNTEFPQNWGLGSSSTLVANLAAWAGVDPFWLNRWAFSGSGYDIACATSQHPIFYQITAKQAVHYQPTNLHYPFVEQLYLVHLGKKQNSREGIQRYRAQGEPPTILLQQISELSRQIAQADHLSSFEQYLLEHEKMVSRYLQMPRQQDQLFDDYPHGIIKSLGAWGGDFVLATSSADSFSTMHYFQQKGFTTIIPASKLLLL